MRTFTTLPVCVAGLLCSAVSVAEVKRDLDSHEHGASTLNVIIDNNAVYLEFESPWNNLVGFEHQPSTPEQVAAVEAAIALLETPLELFVPNNEARCSEDSTNLSSTLSTSEQHSEDEEHAHGDEHAEDEEHAHGDEHAEDEEHVHGDEHAEEHAEDEEHAHDEHDSEIHSEVAVAYTFLCENMDELSTLDVQLFQRWQGIEDVDVQMVGPGGQSAIELDADSSRIDLSSVM